MNDQPNKTGFKEFLQKFNSRDAHPIFQFIKYGIAGGAATAVHMVVFFICALLAFPALTDTDPFVRFFGWLGVSVPIAEVSDTVRASRNVYDNFIAFMFSNAVAYVINIFWVFKRGRHHWLVEVLMFYAVSGISFGIGTALQWALVNYTGIDTTYAFGAQLITAMMINYVCRKFVIFKG